MLQRRKLINAIHATSRMRTISLPTDITAYYHQKSSRQTNIPAPKLFKKKRT